jgi:hypothetical protein
MMPDMIKILSNKALLFDVPGETAYMMDETGLCDNNIIFDFEVDSHTMSSHFVTNNRNATALNAKLQFSRLALWKNMNENPFTMAAFCVFSDILAIYSRATIQISGGRDLIVRPRHRRRSKVFPGSRNAVLLRATGEHHIYARRPLASIGKPQFTDHCQKRTV